VTGLDHTSDWARTSSDPSDAQFGHVVERTGLADAEESDAVLVGEPCDRAVIGQRGAKEGPAALRRKLTSAKTHSYDRGPVATVGDLGDVTPSEDASVAAVQDSVADTTANVHDLDALPVLFGGDNSLRYANVSPLIGRGDDIAVISLDTHLDCLEVRDGPTSGTPYRQLFDAGPVDITVVGAGDFETGTAYADFLDSKGGTIVTPADVSRDFEAAEATAIDSVASFEVSSARRRWTRPTPPPAPT